MDKELKEILNEIVGLIESICLDNYPHACYNEYTLKIDKVKIDSIKEKVSKLSL